MKCTRCSAEIPAQSQFCLRCGTPIHATTLPHTSPIPPAFGAGPRRSNKPLIATIAALALALLALGALYVHSLLTAKAGQGPLQTTIVQAPGALPPSSGLVQAPGDAPVPPRVVQQPGQTPPPSPPPQDVIDYLGFLKRVEASKKQLIHDQAADLAVAQTMLPVDEIKTYLNFDQDSADPHSPQAQDDAKKRVEDLANRTRQIADQWNQLTAYFNSKTPPASCQDLHDRYLDHLGKIQAETIQVYEVLGKVQADPQAALREAEGMKGQSGTIDTAMHGADQALADMCDRFHLTKDFDISEGNVASLTR